MAVVSLVKLPLDECLVLTDMLTGNKPLPESMLTKILVAIWRHQVTMSCVDKMLLKEDPLRPFLFDVDPLFP